MKCAADVSGNELIFRLVLLEPNICRVPVKLYPVRYSKYLLYIVLYIIWNSIVAVPDNVENVRKCCNTAGDDDVQIFDRKMSRILCTKSTIKRQTNTEMPLQLEFHERK